MKTPGVVWDLIGLAGAGSIGYGCWLYDPRIAFLVVGTLAIALALAGARAQRSDPSSRASKR